MTKERRQETEKGRKSQVSPRTVWVIGLNVLAMAFVFLMAYYARNTIVLLIISIFLALALYPIVTFLEKMRIRRGIAVSVVFFLLVMFMGFFLVSFVPMLVDQSRILAAKAPELLEKLGSSEFARWADREFGLIEQGRHVVKEKMGQVVLPVFGILTKFFQGVFEFVTVIVLTFFLLIFGGELFTEGIGHLEPDRRETVLRLSERMRGKVGGYVIGTILVALIGGAVTAVTLLALGVPYFVPLGLAMTFLGIIPYVGAAIGAVLVIGTTFAASGLKAGIVTIVVFVCYQFAENHFLQPFVQRRTIRMSPLIIIVVMLIGTSIAGVLGALLALPIAGMIQVVVEDMVGR